jgi:hypothetical protein
MRILRMLIRNTGGNPVSESKILFNSMSTQRPTGKGEVNAREQLQAREREQAQSQSRSHPQL